MNRIKKPFNMLRTFEKFEKNVLCLKKAKYWPASQTLFHLCIMSIRKMFTDQFPKTRYKTYLTPVTLNRTIYMLTLKFMSTDNRMFQSGAYKIYPIIYGLRACVCVYLCLALLHYHRKLRWCRINNTIVSLFSVLAFIYDWKRFVCRNGFWTIVCLRCAFKCVMSSSWVVALWHRGPKVRKVKDAH